MKVFNNPSNYGSGELNPKSIIVHSIAEYLPINNNKIHAVDFLESIGLSAHILVCPNGDVYRCRNDNQIAYHAKGFNSEALGIEFLVKGVHTYTSFIKTIETPYATDSQINSGIEIIRKWRELHNIKNVAMHSDKSPERKSDPGNGFPFDYVLAMTGE